MQFARSLVRRMCSAPPVMWSGSRRVWWRTSTRGPGPPARWSWRGVARRPGGGVFQLEERVFLSWLLGARAVARLLCERLGVHRCALVSRPHQDRPAQILVLPLHGLDAGWRPHLSEGGEHKDRDLGYCTSKNAPRWSDSSLTRIQTKVRPPDAPSDLTFLGADPAHPGLFSRIVRGEEPHWRVWEDQGHVAFLTPFPNATGFTVLVPRRPLTSDIFRLDREDYEGLVLASRKAARVLQEALGAWGVGLIFEGFEIDYAHAKLIPLLRGEAAPSEGGASETPPPEFHHTYPGYVTSADGPEADPQSLERLHLQITQT